MSGSKQISTQRYVSQMRLQIQSVAARWSIWHAPCSISVERRVIVECDAKSNKSKGQRLPTGSLWDNGVEAPAQHATRVKDLNGLSTKETW
jgi:hypothetical protein